MPRNGAKVPRIQFGLIMPADQLDERMRGTYVADLDRALRLAARHFHGAWLIDHLQFGVRVTQLEGGAAHHHRLMDPRTGHL